jgi:hypothetical protein
MTTAERNIAIRLQAIGSKKDMLDQVFINQLRNWYDRDMSRAGAAKMMRLLDKYQKHIPDHQVLRSSYIDEQLSKMAP